MNVDIVPGNVIPLPASVDDPSSDEDRGGEFLPPGVVSSSRKRKAGNPTTPGSGGKRLSSGDVRSKTKDLPPTSALWNPHTDEFLKEGLRLHGMRWDLVRDHVQQKFLTCYPAELTEGMQQDLTRDDLFAQITAEECDKRWIILRRYLTGAQIVKTFPEWTEVEKQLLVNTVKHALETVEDNTFVKVVNIGDQRVKTVSWQTIAQAMQRDVEDVQYQWNHYRLLSFKRGPFTAQEDRIILQRYQEWTLMSEDLKPRPGLWVALEKEINREDKRISERWRTVLSKRVASLQEELRKVGEVNNTIQMLHLQQQQQHQQQQVAMSMPQMQQQQMQQQIGFSHVQQPGNHNVNAINIHPGHHQQQQQTHMQLQMLSGNTLAVLHPPMQQQHELNSANAALVDAARKLPPVDPNAYAPRVYRYTPKKKRRDGSLDGMSSPDPVDKGPSIRWNEDMDQVLKEAVRVSDSDWKRTAQYVNDNMPMSARLGTVVDDQKCRGRWYRALRHDDPDWQRRLEEKLQASIEAIDQSQED